MSELVWGIKNGDIEVVKNIVENKVSDGLFLVKRHPFAYIVITGKCIMFNTNTLHGLPPISSTIQNQL